MFRQYDLHKGDLYRLCEKTVFYYPEEQFRCPEAFVKLFFLEKKLCILSKECFYLVAADNMLRIQGLFDLSREGKSLCEMDIKNLVVRSLLCGATGVIILHARPCRELNPTQTDVTGTEHVKAGLKLFGIQLLDHIIIGQDSNSYFSFREKNLGDLA